MADIPLLKAPMALTDLAGAAAAADGQVPTADGLGGVAWEAQAGGGGGSTELLAVHSYYPASATSHAVTSATAVDIDATNLVITFTAPASGSVLVRLAARGVAGESELAWNLRDSGGDIAGTTAIMAYQSGGRCNYSVRRTGLTAGTSYTWKWGASRTYGTAGTQTWFGGTAGQALMEVWSA